MEALSSLPKTQSNKSNNRKYKPQIETTELRLRRFGVNRPRQARPRVSAV
jgi:hypothetical protein